MSTNKIIWLTGFIIATVLLFPRLKKKSDDTGERIVGSLFLGVFSWLTVVMIIIVSAIDLYDRRRER